MASYIHNEPVVPGAPGLNGKRLPDNINVISGIKPFSILSPQEAPKEICLEKPASEEEKNFKQKAKELADMLHGASDNKMMMDSNSLMSMQMYIQTMLQQICAEAGEDPQRVRDMMTQQLVHEEDAGKKKHKSKKKNKHKKNGNDESESDSEEDEERAAKKKRDSKKKKEKSSRKNEEKDDERDSSSQSSSSTSSDRKKKSNHYPDPPRKIRSKGQKPSLHEDFKTLGEVGSVIYTEEEEDPKPRLEKLEYSPLPTISSTLSKKRGLKIKKSVYIEEEDGDSEDSTSDSDTEEEDTRDKRNMPKHPSKSAKRTAAASESPSVLIPSREYKPGFKRCVNCVKGCILTSLILIALLLLSTFVFYGYQYFALRPVQTDVLLFNTEASPQQMVDSSYYLVVQGRNLTTTRLHHHSLQILSLPPNYLDNNPSLRDVNVFLWTRDANNQMVKIVVQRGDSWAINTLLGADIVEYTYDETKTTGPSSSEKRKFVAKHAFDIDEELLYAKRIWCSPVPTEDWCQFVPFKDNQIVTMTLSTSEQICYNKLVSSAGWKKLTKLSLDSVSSSWSRHRMLSMLVLTHKICLDEHKAQFVEMAQGYLLKDTKGHSMLIESYNLILS